MRASLLGVPMKRLWHSLPGPWTHEEPPAMSVCVFFPGTPDVLSSVLPGCCTVYDGQRATADLSAS